MNFRELTNQECALNRDQLSSDPKRSVLECKVLQSLNADMDRFFQSGGKVKLLPAMSLSHTDSYAEQNKAQKEAHAARNAKREREGVSI